MSYSTLILDLGDVLFTWSPQTNTNIPPRILKSIVSSPTWSEYERGRISQAECYERAASEFSLHADSLATAFTQARETLQSNDALFALVKELKAQHDGNLRVFALSNMSIPDYEYVLARPLEWSIFDKVYTSGLVGERKPEVQIYRYLIEDTGIDPHSAVFLDDKLENVVVARSLGMRGIVFDETGDTLRVLQNIFQRSCQRGREFLRLNAGRMESFTDGGAVCKENFAQLLILELTEDESLVHLGHFARTWKFFRGQSAFSEQFPDDLDTTALALSIVKTDPAVVLNVMDEMLKWRTADGIVQTYFDESRPRIDHVVNVNVLTLFYANGRGRELDESLHWVRDVLLHRAHLRGSRYYGSPDLFLYFTSRLLAKSSDAYLHAQLESLLVERVKERIGQEGDAMELACRVLVCAACGTADDADLQNLREQQCEDGGWGVCWLYLFGKSGVRIGNRGVSTALAIKALEGAKQSQPLESEFNINSHVEIDDTGMEFH